MREVKRAIELTNGLVRITPILLSTAGSPYEMILTQIG